MKLYLQPRPLTLSRAFHRVATELGARKPAWAELVSCSEDADVQLLHVIGKGSLTDIDLKIPYIVFQACLKTTEEPTPEAWLPFWEQASFVWSYLDIKGFLGSDLPCPYLRTPLGVSDVFRQGAVPHKRPFTIITSGYVAEPESIIEVNTAVRAVNGQQVHIGPRVFPRDPCERVHYAMGITDLQLRDWYDRCQYVSGLRRVEGFELGAAEALCRGCRPILFSAPHYWDWYGNHALYIHEREPRIVAEQVQAIITKTSEPMSEDELQAAREFFDWKNIAGRFWDTVKNT